jgi:polyferredoxin
MAHFRKFLDWIAAPMGRRLDRTWRSRRLVQTGFLLTCVFIGWQFTRFIQAAEAGVTPLPVRPPGVEGFLPISGLMGLRDWWIQGELNVIHPAATMLVLIFLVTAVLLRKAFCSWICPVGLISEMHAWVGRKTYGRNFRMWRWLDLPLRSLKWLLLGFFSYHIFYKMPAMGLRAFIESPYNRVSDIKMGLFFVEIGTVGLVVLILLVVGSTFINGFWCRYLCPYGALLGFVSRFSPTRVQRDPLSCIDCGKCDQICMARLPVSTSTNMWSVECTGCMDCIAACPVDDALNLKAGRRKLPVWGFATAVVLLFLGGYVGARVAGLWENQISDAEYIYRIEEMHTVDYGHPGMDGR